MYSGPGPIAPWKIAAFFILLVPAPACNQPDPPPAAYMGPTLACAELGLEPIPCEPSGFVVLEQEPSQGRFPGALAVARLAPAKDLGADTASGPDWRLDTIKEERATYWTSLFNTVSSIREVVILDEPVVERPEAGPDQIAAAARRMRADLCLIWGPCAAQPDHAALIGVIMDTDRLHPVAFVQADAGPEDFRSPAEDAYPGDRRHEDVNYLADRKFDQQVKDCVFELIARDQKTTTTQPSPWKGFPAMPDDDRAVPVYIVPNRSTGQ